MKIAWKETLQGRQSLASLPNSTVHFWVSFSQGPCYNSPHLRGSSRGTERHQQREHGADQDPRHCDRDALEAQAEVHRDVSKQQLAVWGAPRLGRGAPCHRRLEPVHRHPRLGPGGGQCCARCCQGGWARHCVAAVASEQRPGHALLCQRWPLVSILVNLSKLGLLPCSCGCF